MCVITRYLEMVNCMRESNNMCKHSLKISKQNKLKPVDNKNITKLTTFRKIIDVKIKIIKHTRVA